jgi:beta-mannosidase
MYLEIEHPQLWWAHDLGEPALYTLRATLYRDGEQLELRQQEVGIRTLELDQSPDAEELGTRFFRFVLNGVPIFARGADGFPPTLLWERCLVSAMICYCALRERRI